VSKRILIFRPDNIGDVILFSGALRHLRKLFDGATLTMAVQPAVMNLLELCPWVDRVVPVEEFLPERQWRGLANYLSGLLQRACAPENQDFDLVLFPVKSPQPGHLDALWCRGLDNIAGISGCTVNAPRGGYPRHLTPARLYTDCFDASRLDPWLHELELNRLYLRHLGCTPEQTGDLRPTIWTSAEDRAFAASRLPGGRPLVGIFPGASDPRKCWQSAQWAQVAAALHDSGNFLLFGSPNDVALCQELERALREARPDWPVLNLCGETSLRQLYCCLERLALLCCTDSAGLHLGITAGIATVAVTGGWHKGRFTAWGDPERNICLTHELPCQGCNWSCSRPKIDCLNLIEPLEVADCANRLLARAVTRQPGTGLVAAVKEK
jgi:ADP-heptose:LPS heptosyltransferase